MQLRCRLFLCRTRLSRRRSWRASRWWAGCTCATTCATRHFRCRTPRGSQPRLSSRSSQAGRTRSTRRPQPRAPSRRAGPQPRAQPPRWALCRGCCRCCPRQTGKRMTVQLTSMRGHHRAPRLHRGWQRRALQLLLRLRLRLPPLRRLALAVERAVRCGCCMCWRAPPAAPKRSQPPRPPLRPRCWLLRAAWAQPPRPPPAPQSPWKR